MLQGSAFRAGRQLPPASRRGVSRSPSRLLTVRVRAERVLIVNTKKGGHAFLGLYTAKALLGRGHSVTLFNDGDESLQAKAPFCQYAALAKNNPAPRGLSVEWGDPTDPKTYPEGTFDVVMDNNGKSMDECQPLIDTFAKEVKQYIFVGSAGAYVADSGEPMHVEGDARKSSAGHKVVEDYLERVGAPYTVFQPLYMYGEFTAKDCEQWFIDRISRGRPVPIPAPAVAPAPAALRREGVGVQLTSVSHVEDVASMIAMSVGNKGAVGQHYNACTDRCVTLDGLAQCVAKAMGKEAQIVHYNPKDFDIPKGKGFPFRAVHFFAGTDKAKHELGWAPQHALVDDLETQVYAFFTRSCVAMGFDGNLFDGVQLSHVGLAVLQVAVYREQGRDRKDIDFSVDDMILSGAR